MKRYITHDVTGEVRSLSEWAQIIGINITTLSYRLDECGLPLSEAINFKRGSGRKKTPKPLPCGAKHGLDCLNCKYAACICPSRFLPGEGRRE